MEELKTARAQLVHARIAPRKVQIVCDMIRGKDTKIAEAYMANTPKAGCELMLKLLKSACANAENNFEMDPDNLYVAEAYATAGPILKRGRPRAQGRMNRINKRTSHITIVVAEKASGRRQKIWDRKLIRTACVSASSKIGIPAGMPVTRRSVT